jgi:hypothetical protein
MANAYTAPLTYSPTISTMGIAQLTGQVQTTMQQKFDINLAKVDDLIQKITNVPLARPEDKEYLGNRLNSLLSMVDANSKVDLTNNNVARQINNYISTAIDDNVKKQIGNSQKIQTFQQEAARIKKEKPELYNDANYAYAMDKSGYAAYMNGETDDLGSLQYKEYYDVPKNLNEPLEKWAKEMGFEKVADSSVEGGYIYKTVKGKTLTEEQIANFVENRIATDSNLKQQLVIDSYYKYRGVSDEDLLKNYKEAVKPVLDNMDMQITEVDYQIKNTNPDDAEKLQLLNQKKANISKKKEFAEAQANGEGFNRDSFLYNNHVNNLTESYKKAFGYAAITDIDFNDMFLDEANKKDDTSTSGTGGGGTAGLPAGTAFKRDLTPEEAKAYQEGEEKKGSVLKRYKDGRQQAWNTLQGTIKQQLVKEGKGTSAKDVENFYVGLREASKRGFDVNAQAYPSDVIDNYKKVEQYNKQSYHLSKVSEEVYSKDINRIFDGLFGGKSKDLNVENLAITAPKTAELLKKYKSASQVPARDKILAQYEIAKNIRDYVFDEIPGSDDEDKERMNFFIEGYKQKNKISDKEIAKYKPKDTDSGWSGLGTMLQGAGQALWNTTVAPALSTLSTFTDTTGEDYMKAVKGDEAGLDRGINRLKTGAKQFWNSASRLFSQDTDLSEIESGDIKLNKYESPKDIITTNKETLKNSFDTLLKANLANAPEGTSIVLNRESKVDKVLYSQIEAAIVAAGGSPDKDSNFVTITSVDEKNGIANISYSSVTMIPKEKGGQTKEVNTVPIPIKLENLPTSLVKSLGQKSNWEFSSGNTTPMKATFNYKPFNDLDSRYEFTKRFLENNNLSQEEASFYQSSNFSEFKTREEFINEASKYLPAEDAKLFYNDILNSNYSVEFEKPKGGGGFIPYIIKDGKKVLQENPLAVDYNTSNFNKITAVLINKYIGDQISEMRKKAFYKQTM